MSTTRDARLGRAALSEPTSTMTGSIDRSSHPPRPDGGRPLDGAAPFDSVGRMSFNHRSKALALVPFAWGCAIADTDVDIDLAAPPAEAQKAPEVSVVLDDGSTGYCPPDTDGGPVLCVLYCPKDNPSCGVMVNECAAFDKVDNYGTPGSNGQTTTADCVAAGPTKCLQCCTACMTNALNTTNCGLACPTN